MPVKLVVGKFVASCKSNAGVASVPPNARLIPPNDTVLFDNLSFAIEPAN